MNVFTGSTDMNIFTINSLIAILHASGVVRVLCTFTSGVVEITSGLSIDIKRQDRKRTVKIRL